MPKAAKQFMVGNRMVARGETFEIPAGETEAEYAGLIEGTEAPGGEPRTITGPEPLGGVVGAAGVEPGAAETQEDVDARAERSGAKRSK